MAAPASPGAPSLLLLPAPPEPAAPDVVRAAYREPLESVISKLSEENRPDSSSSHVSAAPVLVVAVVGPMLRRRSTNGGSGGRAVPWRRLQSLLAELYSIIASICAQKSIASDLGADDVGAVDARVVLVDDSCPPGPGPDGDYEPNNTVVLDLPTFASKVSPWMRIFHPSSEPGYGLLATYLKYAEGKQRLLQNQLIAVGGGLSLSRTQDAAAAAAAADATASDANSNSDEDTHCYKTTCLGGTFDHLHPGHKLFLHAAILLLDVPDHTGGNDDHCELVIGISSDQLLAKKKHAQELQSWDVRARAVLSHLSSILNFSTTLATATLPVQAETKELHASFRDGALLVRCVDFSDVYGPTVKEEGIQALVVSGETRSGGKAVNDKRVEQGWAALDVFEIDVLDASVDGGAGVAEAGAGENFAFKISSTEIRKQKAEARTRTSQAI